MMNFFRSIAQLINPPVCCVCGKRIEQPQQPLCAACNLHLPRTYHVGNPQNNEMAKLFWGKVELERAAAYVYYGVGNHANRPVLQLKYAHQHQVGQQMGLLMATEWLPENFFQDVDLLLPVPLTPQRRQQRGYNQSTMLAQGIAQATGIDVVENVVVRSNFETSQTHKNFAERTNNVEKSFHLIPNTLPPGKHVMLIDDVVTTGATLCTVAKLLKQLPDTRVSAATWGFAFH